MCGRGGILGGGHTLPATPSEPGFEMTVLVPASQSQGQDSRIFLAMQAARGWGSAAWIRPEHQLNAKLCSKCHPESSGVDDVTVPAAEQLAM